MDKTTKTSSLKVYYDGACHLCSREIDHYKKQMASVPIEFIDVSHSRFDAKAEGVDPYLVNKYFHVRTEQGDLISGVEAFRKIWQILPKYHFLYRLSGFGPLNILMRSGYKVFAEIRPYLPKKVRDCESEFCSTQSHP